MTSVLSFSQKRIPLTCFLCGLRHYNKPLSGNWAEERRSDSRRQLKWSTRQLWYLRKNNIFILACSSWFWVESAAVPARYSWSSRITWSPSLSPTLIVPGAWLPFPFPSLPQVFRFKAVIIINSPIFISAIYKTSDTQLSGCCFQFFSCS